MICFYWFCWHGFITHHCVEATDDIELLIMAMMERGIKKEEMNERTDREIVERKRLERHTNGHFEERERERES